jgi:hypothetical protein
MFRGDSAQEAAMARRTRNVVEFDEEESGSSFLSRFLVWGGLTAVALGTAALAAQTQTGGERLAHLLGKEGAVLLGARSTSSPPPAAVQPSDTELESRRLAEAVRVLAADRDRLLARLDTLERNLDVTGSIPREHPVPEFPAAGSTQLPPNWSIVPRNLPPAAGVAVPGESTAAAPGQSAPPANHASPAQQTSRATAGFVVNGPAAESVATKTEFGIDVGGDSSFEGLRALWASLKGSQATLLEGLRPVVAVREGAKPGILELRLVVGPLTNAGAAARLCATLAGTGVLCQPTIFDGQRLALR